MPTITIPMTIPSQNTRDHWHWRRRQRDRNQWISYIMAMKPRSPPPDKRMLVVIISIRKRLITDDANLRGGAKGLVDALVRTGILVDDSDKWCEIIYKQMTLGQAMKSKPQTIIGWEEMSDGE